MTPSTLVRSTLWSTVWAMVLLFRSIEVPAQVPDRPGPPSAAELLVPGATVRVYTSPNRTRIGEVLDPLAAPGGSGLLVRLDGVDTVFFAAGARLDVSQGMTADARWAGFGVALAATVLTPKCSEQGAILCVPLLVGGYLIGRAIKRHSWLQVVVP